MVDILDLTNQQVRAVNVTVEREAGFDNTVDFYQVEANGSIIDPDSGQAIALGEPEYTEAAIANRLGLDLTTENGETTESTVDFAKNGLYAPIIAVDSGFEPLEDNNTTNDLVVYVSDAAANHDGFDHLVLINNIHAAKEDQVAIDYGLSEVEIIGQMKPLVTPPQECYLWSANFTAIKVE